MFGKLRVKLALMNAGVAALILLAISAVAYLFIVQLIARQSEQQMMQIARSLDMTTSFGGAPGGDAIGFAGGSYPYLILQVDESGTISVAGSFRMYLSQGDLNELVDRSVSAEQKFFDSLGKLPGEQDRRIIVARRTGSAVIRLSDGRAFRYTMAGLRPGGASLSIIYLDIQQEEGLLASVRLALGGSVLGGLLLTLLGGLFLAGRALRPIRVSWQKQRSFVADASHELRSPLAAIQCNLDVVLDDLAATVGEKQQYWEGISEETGRMAVLVDELLLLARADSDAIVFQKERVELADVAANAVAFLQPLAAKRGIALSLETSARPAVSGDQARLKQVLIALVDNALKYTPAGGSISVTVKKAKDRAQIDVSDTGIGIPKEHIARIFERFYRVDSARERESGGHGLGLSIAQWIVHRHGGSITVASEEGRGSCFTVWLPVAKE
jgi:two-component system, OmpR family, sensor histidine kinase CiaH